MRRTSFILAVLVLAGISTSAASGASTNASCNGILVSSLAGQAGLVGTLTRQFHQELKDAGVPPGVFDSTGAHVHAGGVVECLEALGVEE